MREWKRQCKNYKLQTEKEERKRTVNDYEMLFSEMNYQFNNEYGDWYD